jgi:hypothetical protein
MEQPNENQQASPAEGSPQWTAAAMPALTQDCANRGADWDAALARQREKQDILDANAALGKFYARRLNELSLEWERDNTESRLEAFALGEHYDFAGRSGRRRAKIDTLEHVRELYTYLTTTKADLDMSSFLEGVANSASAEFRALASAELVHRAQLIIATASVLEVEGDRVQVTGARTIELRGGVVAASKRADAAMFALGEFNAQADKRRVAWASKGILTSSNVRNTIASY